MFSQNNVKYMEFLKYASMMILFLLLISFLRMLLHFAFHSDKLDKIKLYLSIFPAFLGIASIAMVAQDKYKNTN